MPKVGSGRVPVTVVIPAYRAADHLADSLESVRAQTLSIDEIIVVLDGPDDAAADIARSYGVRVLEHDVNRGVSAARNTGIRASANEWIALLDADDMWKAEKIARQWTVVERYDDALVVFSDCEHVRDGEVVRSRFLPEHDPYHGVEKKHLDDRVYRLDRASVGRALFPGNFLMPSSLMFRRDLFERAGGFDERFTAPDSGIGTCEDQDLALRLVMETDPFVIEEPLVSYCRREGSLSSDSVSLRLGFAYLADKVASDSSRYPEGAVEYFRKEKPIALREAAVTLMHRGDFDRARELLLRSLHDRFTLRAAAGLTACLLGERTFSWLLRVKRSLDWLRPNGS